jgi:hypothetical protein
MASPTTATPSKPFSCPPKHMLGGQPPPPACHLQHASKPLTCAHALLKLQLRRLFYRGIHLLQASIVHTDLIGERGVYVASWLCERERGGEGSGKDWQRDCLSQEVTLPLPLHRTKSTPPLPPRPLPTHKRLRTHT